MNYDDYEELVAAAAAALQHAHSLPPGIARSEALKEAGRLRSVVDQLHPPSFRPAVAGPNIERVSRNEERAERASWRIPRRPRGPCTSGQCA